MQIVCENVKTCPGNKKRKEMPNRPPVEVVGDNPFENKSEMTGPHDKRDLCQRPAATTIIMMTERPTNLTRETEPPVEVVGDGY